MSTFSIEPIAHIFNNYKDKFGIPRQSNLAGGNTSTVVFEEKYRDENALRGLEGYDRIWLIWLCDKAEVKDNFSPTVRPPRLGGNKRMGVFATRSPFHPNRLGLSCVKLIGIEKSKNDGFVLKVSGEDLLNGTPIIDIKPYLPFSDSYPEAKFGFAEAVLADRLEVIFPEDSNILDQETKSVLAEILAQDPRPAYHNDKERIYNMDYGNYKLSFFVDGNVLTVISLQKTDKEADL